MMDKHLLDYLAQEGINPQNLSNHRAILVDTGFAGTIPSTIQAQIRKAHRTVSEKIITHLICSEADDIPSSRVFLSAINSSAATREPSTMHGAIISYEYVSHYTEKANSFQLIGNRWEAVAPEKSKEEFRRETRKLMGDIRETFDNSKARAEFVKMYDRLNSLTQMLTGEKALDSTLIIENSRYLKANGAGAFFTDLAEAVATDNIKVDSVRATDFWKSVPGGKPTLTASTTIKKVDYASQHPELEPYLLQPDEKIPNLKLEDKAIILKLIDSGNYEIHKTLLKRLSDPQFVNCMECVEALIKWKLIKVGAILLSNESWVEKLKSEPLYPTLLGPDQLSFPDFVETLRLNKDLQNSELFQKLLKAHTYAMTHHQSQSEYFDTLQKVREIDPILATHIISLLSKIFKTLPLGHIAGTVHASIKNWLMNIPEQAPSGLVSEVLYRMSRTHEAIANEIADGLLIPKNQSKFAALFSQPHAVAIALKGMLVLEDIPGSPNEAAKLKGKVVNVLASKRWREDPYFITLCGGMAPTIECLKNVKIELFDELVKNEPTNTKPGQQKGTTNKVAYKEIRPSLSPGEKIKTDLGEMVVIRLVDTGKRATVFQVKDKNGKVFALKVAKNMDQETLKSLENERSKALDLKSLGVSHAEILETQKTYVVKNWVEGLRADQWLTKWQAAGSSLEDPAFLNLVNLLDKVAKQNSYIGDLNAKNLILVNSHRWVVIDSGSVRDGIPTDKAWARFVEKFSKRWNAKFGECLFRTLQGLK